ncbi:hypothetical protein D3C81_1987440 [compost metagenome]
MNLITAKIQHLVSGSETSSNLPAVKLSSFKKVASYDVTERYLVSDKWSNKKFHVTFYFYGGILSGWNVDVAT